MPEHGISTEAQWLEPNYSELGRFDGRWIAVVKADVVDDDSDEEALVNRVTERYGEGVALFASVVLDRLG